MKCALYIVVLIIVSFFTSCKGQVDNNSNQVISYEIYKSNTIKTLPYVVCDYYIEFGKYPISKEVFEEYLKKVNIHIPILKILSPMNYGFQINSREKMLSLYDWGYDRNDDRLKESYTLNDNVASTQSGDLLVMTIDFDICNSLVRKNKTELVFYNNDLILDVPKEMRREIKQVIIGFATSSRNKNETYVPISKETIPKLSIVKGILKDEKWVVNIEENEHEKSEIEKLSRLFESWLTKSEFILKKEINMVRIPIEYYDDGQLVILK